MITVAEDMIRKAQELAGRHQARTDYINTMMTQNPHQSHSAIWNGYRMESSLIEREMRVH